MQLPKLKTRVVESDPYRTVCIVSDDHAGQLILAECNGSGKAEVAAEIVRCCNERPTLRRAWINQPSTQQPLHHLHGVNVLASSDIRDGTCIIYFLGGDVISQECNPARLSDGWK